MKNRTLPFAFMLAPLAATAACGQKATGPNILFIQCDQLNTLALGCYGGPVPTPNIDRLAEAGVLFSDAICTTPVSSPSRATIVTSLYTHQHGVVQNVPTIQGITDDDITTDRILHENGYDTRHYGKWHLASSNEGNLKIYPDPYDFSDYKKENGELLKRMKETAGGDWMKSNAVSFPVELTPEKKAMQESLRAKWSDRQFADMAINMGRLRMDADDWVDAKIASATIDALNGFKKSETPFAITCSFIWPHDPNFVPDPYYSAVDPDKIELSDIRFIEEQFLKDWSHEMAEGFGEDGMREFLRIYYACVMYIDDQVGRILAALDENGQTENTVVVFTADHGDMMTAHEMMWKSTSSFYKEIVNVPLIISYPGHIREGVVSKAQTSLVDMMPTFLDIAGIDTPESAAGQSLVPLLTGKTADTDFRKYNFCERIHAGKKKAKGQQIGRDIKPEYTIDVMVQDSGWKYIRYTNGQEYLYDRINDPDETRNMADNGKYASVKAEMAAATAEWLEETGWKGKKY